jgi:sulfite reductase (NADPH) flavoprotein alpha-component
MPNILPENSPFSSAQRAWLDGFFSASLGVVAPNGTAPPPALVSAPAPVAAPKAPAPLPAAPAKLSPSYTREHPFPARVLSVRELCGPESEKDVRAISFDLTGSGLQYEAGDALGVYPENSPELVRHVLALMEATGEEPVVTPESRIVPARIALAFAYDIMKPSEGFLSMMADFAGDDDERELLCALAEGEDDWIDGRDVIDVLERFQSARPPVSELIASLATLQPRLYSIASSQKAYPTQVHLTVGVVRYTLHDRERKGVTSTFLAERIPLGEQADVTPGHSVAIFVHPSPHFKVPEDTNVPIIMVGPGTGIAPFRAFLQERRATGAAGRNWLFFGDQRAASDYLYRDEIEEFLADGTLARLDLAFSRDQERKIYVQHRMLEAAEELWHWLEEGAYFYVCGDAKRMAKDVHSALLQIIQEQGHMDDGAAKSYLQDLAKTHRYARDVY